MSKMQIYSENDEIKESLYQESLDLDKIDQVLDISYYSNYLAEISIKTMMKNQFLQKQNLEGAKVQEFHGYSLVEGTLIQSKHERESKSLSMIQEVTEYTNTTEFMKESPKGNEELENLKQYVEKILTSERIERDQV